MTAKFDSDWRSYQTFAEKWHDGTLTSSDPVYGLVRNLAYLLCHREQLDRYRDDLHQNVLRLIIRFPYEGRCPLGAYVTLVAKRELARMAKKDRVSITDPLPEGKEPANFPLRSVREDVVRRLELYDELRRILRRGDLMSKVLKTTARCHAERTLSLAEITRRIQEVDPSYTPYRIRKAYEKLLERLKQFRE